jgi:hypothetical protein
VGEGLQIGKESMDVDRDGKEGYGWAMRGMNGYAEVCRGGGKDMSCILIERQEQE